VKTYSPKILSVIIHFTIFVFFFLIIKLQSFFTIQTIEVPILVDFPTTVMNIKEVEKEQKVVIKSVNSIDEKKGSTREVFGINRNSLTDNTSGEAGVVAKIGNTTAKAFDNEVLKPTDSDSLPTPTEEYLVSQMPRVVTEIRPIYPPIARAKQKEGKVVLDVLIDEKGSVRKVEVVESEEIFRNEAVEAMMKFKFSPANVNGKNVAVKIRYVIKFKLEY
jgi:TonB family protein